MCGDLYVVTFGCLDYAGISLLICGSFAIVTYYSFYCDAFWRQVYLTQIVLFGSVGIVGPWLSFWRSSDFRWGRVLVYTSSAVASAIPIFHYLLVYGLPHHIEPLGWINIAFCYLFGSFIYGSRMPERFFPGKFDILFHSHQFWHVFVVIACMLQYFNSLELLKWRLDHGCLIINK